MGIRVARTLLVASLLVTLVAAPTLARCETEASPSCCCAGGGKCPPKRVIDLARGTCCGVQDAPPVRGGEPAPPSHAPRDSNEVAARTVTAELPGTSLTQSRGSLTDAARDLGPPHVPLYTLHAAFLI